MRWDFGSIYKMIRESKGLTQEQVCGNALSRTTLAKIESNQSMPKFENMIFLLDQLNMSLEEFRYICNLYQPSIRQNIFNDIYNYSSSSNRSNLKDIREQCEKHLRTHHDIPIEYVLDMVTVGIAVREHGFLQPSQELQIVTQKIWSMLEKQDTWYERDLKMLSAILFHFPLEQLPDITDRILDSLRKYKDYSQIADTKHSLLSNLATIYLYNHSLKECEKITCLTYDLAKQTKRYDRLGFSSIRLGICRNEQELIDQGLAILELAQEETLLEAMRIELEKFYKK
ncbi:helix-turn-helix domain-containing protein [Streptococcus suis]|nr:helix-turn-helix domain-containing protein [Streptococcus suis]